MARRNLYLAPRQKEDDSRLDRISTKTRPVVVEQAGSWPPFAIVQASGFSKRQPRYTDENALLRRALKAFEPEVFRVPEGRKWCSECGDWVNKDNFSPKKGAADGLQYVCKTCRNDYARRVYATSLDREVRTYTRKAA